MTDQETRFLALAQKYEKLSVELDTVREELNSAMADIGVDKYVQDLNTLAVYKIIEPTGTFMFYKKLDYKRTNLDGEKGGGGTVLSKKEAQEAGFVLGK